MVLHLDKKKEEVREQLKNAFPGGLAAIDISQDFNIHQVKVKEAKGGTDTSSYRWKSTTLLCQSFLEHVDRQSVRGNAELSSQLGLLTLGFRQPLTE